MKRMIAIAAVVGALVAGAVAPAQAELIADYGCTPGYWKQAQHVDSWEEATPDRLLAHPDPTAWTFRPTGERADDTFLQALNYKGGSGVAGAEQILLRAAVAAWLNAAHETVGYPVRRHEIVADVNAAIRSGDRARMLELAAELDRMNNLGCPLS